MPSDPLAIPDIDPTIVDPLALFRLDDQVAIVTGASSGLGDRFARVLHAAGATVVLAARRADRLEALAAQLPGSIVVPTDVSDAAQRERLIETVIDRCGTIHVLVNNAGISADFRVEDEPLETFREVMEVNVTAIWHLSKLASVPMVARGYGSIVNVASMLGNVASTPIKQANYCASKGAVINMSRELAAQWARKGVRVNSLCPGWFASEMTAEMSNEANQRWVAQNSPIPRMGHAHELDGALLLLASPAGTFITGHDLLVDGGWTAR